jgi:hypothetical protein
MKLRLEVTFNDGTAETFVAAVPEWQKWEVKFNKTIQQAENIGINDLVFLAYSAMKRAAGAKPIKPFDAWVETISDIQAVNDNPKGTESEA